MTRRFEYLPVYLNKPFDMKFTGRLRSICCNPRETQIFSFTHMTEPVLDFLPIGGFPAHLLPRLDILLLIGASCKILANEPTPWAINPPREIQAILEIEIEKDAPSFR